jgi:hypothetical protein
LIQPFEVGRDRRGCRTRRRRARRIFANAVFTEGRKWNEETGVGLHQISKQALFFRLMQKNQQRFAIFCSK